jgi:hypothetical protein
MVRPSWRGDGWVGWGISYDTMRATPGLVKDFITDVEEISLHAVR